MSGKAATATMYCYPWDLEGEELKPRFHQLRELGISTLQLAVSYHAATFLMPNKPADLVLAADPGAIYFSPAGPLAQGTSGIKPHVPARTFDLDQLVETALAAGLETTAWTVFCYSHSLARRYPQHAVRSAFREHHIAQLCPNNAQTRAYFQRLVSELIGRYRFAGMVFESLSFLPFSYGWINTKSSVTVPEELEDLLSTCFCDSCLNIAAYSGVDGERVRSQVREVCRRELNRLPLPDTTRISLSGLDVSAFNEYRTLNRRELQGFHVSMLEGARASGLSVDSTATYDAPPASVTGIDPASLRSIVASSRIAIRPDIRSEEVSSLLECRQSAFPDSRIDVLIEPGEYTSKAAFLNTIAACHRAGVNNFRFYSLSTMTLEQLGWLEAGKQYWAGQTT